MREVTVAAIQMSCSPDPALNIEAAARLVREAAEAGAGVILLPELFENRYFPQERRYEYYALASPLLENAAIKRLSPLAAELGVVLPVSFYERDSLSLYNSVAMIDADGEILGVYRKTHIPDDHFYQEKFYFTPGDSGFRVFDTRRGRIGVGICWDQWFPETARALALGGAELLLYPTAIGSEPILGQDSAGHWRRCMQGHSAANIIPLAAANRVGAEAVEPCGANGGQRSELLFYGSSFMTDETGAVVRSAGREGEAIIIHTYELDKIAQNRLSWGLFRDRRPECYSDISGGKK